MMDPINLSLGLSTTHGPRHIQELLLQWGVTTLFLCAYPLRAGVSFKGKYQLDGEHTEYDVVKKVLCVDTAHSFPLLPFAYRHLNVQCRWMGRPATVFFSFL